MPGYWHPASPCAGAPVAGLGDCADASPELLGSFHKGYSALILGGREGCGIDNGRETLSLICYKHIEARMGITLNVSGVGTVTINERTDKCPICKNSVTATAVVGRFFRGFYDADLEVVYVCPNTSCSEYFISYYKKYSTAGGGVLEYILLGSKPSEIASFEVSDLVQKLSPSFYMIYNEAFKAEKFGLKEICGVDYRKAFEFLIKDYLIKKSPGLEIEIKRSALGACIENRVVDERIKQIAKRTAWLGNDETHYERKWINKDLSDLKTLINVTLHWIEMETLTEETLKSMP